MQVYPLMIIFGRNWPIYGNFSVILLSLIFSLNMYFCDRAATCSFEITFWPFLTTKNAFITKIFANSRNVFFSRRQTQKFFQIFQVHYYWPRLYH